MKHLKMFYERKTEKSLSTELNEITYFFNTRFSTNQKHTIINLFHQHSVFLYNNEVASDERKAYLLTWMYLFIFFVITVYDSSQHIWIKFSIRRANRQVSVIQSNHIYPKLNNIVFYLSEFCLLLICLIMCSNKSI